ncbi:MAG: NAD(+)/NADH kinase [Solirubrobacteraceae bacterium]
MSGTRRATVFTHRRPSETAPALRRLLELGRDAGMTLRFDREETLKHSLEPEPGLELDAPVERDVEICFALGGDGTMLTALRRYAGTGVPVFGVNFGEIGFLAAVDRENAADGFKAALSGDFEVLSLPGIELSAAAGHWVAMNDVSIQRQPGKRVADLAYSVDSAEVGRVRCDGLVIATPVGSTGYNLANGGPVMAWGVEGLAVSFIAPHSLTARALVVAPSDRITVHNRSQEEPVDVAIDGRPVHVLDPGAKIEATFAGEQGALAQIPGTTFYGRLREKFGRLAVGP